jgi:DNA polymerase sigma
MSQNKISNLNQFYTNFSNFQNNNNQNLNIYQNKFYQNQNNIKNYQYQNSNFKIQNQFFNQKYSPEALKSEYFQLKNLEHDNPKLIKENILQYENQIIIPIYQQINKSNILKKNFYIELYNKYKNIIELILKKNKLEVNILQAYGSIMNNFLIDEGDIDISIVPKNLSIEQFSIFLDEIRNDILLKKLGQCDNLHISPRYSLLKVKDYQTQINIDITVHTMLPIYNTKLIRIYSLLDQRFHIMGIFIKYWVKKNHINGAYEKFLSSYAILILIIHFLQSEIDIKILPILQKVENKIIKYEYSHSGKELITNIYFEEDFEKINNYLKKINYDKENNDSVGELILKFFEFYSYKYEHDYLISIHHNEKKNCKGEHLAFPMEDPFDIEHNPGKSMKLNTPQFDLFLNCMRKEINNILSGDLINKNFINNHSQSNE